MVSDEKFSVLKSLINCCLFLSDRYSFSNVSIDFTVYSLSVNKVAG